MERLSYIEEPRSPDEHDRLPPLEMRPWGRRFSCAAVLISAMTYAAMAASAAGITLDAPCGGNVLERGDELSSWSAIYNRVFDLDAAADDEWRAIGSVQEFDVRRQKLRERMIARIGGFPERTPLNAKVTGTMERKGYRIENVLFESRPGAYVTGNLYLPADVRFAPPYPAALELCGHSPLGKNAPKYQRVAMLAARSGVAVLVIDPAFTSEALTM